MSKAILINTPLKAVHAIEIDLHSLEAIYAAIGCQAIDRFPNSESDWFYCDEQALSKVPLPPYFLLRGFPHRIYGKALVFGSNGSQEVEPQSTIEEVTQKTLFVD
jgi:hypothetical protein